MESLKKDIPKKLLVAKKCFKMAWFLLVNIIPAKP